MKKILPFDVKIVPGSTPGSAAGNGTVIDRLNYRTALIGLAAGTIAASSSITARIQHGDKTDGTDMADFKPDGTVVSTSLSTSDTNASVSVDLTGAKKYIRLVTASTGTAPDFSTYIALGDCISGDGFES